MLYDSSRAHSRVSAEMVTCKGGFAWTGGACGEGLPGTRPTQRRTAEDLMEKWRPYPDLM